MVYSLTKIKTNRITCDNQLNLNQRRLLPYRGDRYFNWATNQSHPLKNFCLAALFTLTLPFSFQKYNLSKMQFNTNSLSKNFSYIFLLVQILQDIDHEFYPVLLCKTFGPSCKVSRKPGTNFLMLNINSIIYNTITGEI